MLEIFKDFPVWRIFAAIASLLVFSLPLGLFGKYLDRRPSIPRGVPPSPRQFVGWLYRLNCSFPFIGDWLKQIGSDIYWYAWSIGGLASIGIIAGHWGDPSPILIPIAQLFSVGFFCLLTIAAISVGGEELEYRVSQSTSLESTDRRNYLTAIPFGISVVKLLVYVATVIGVLSSLKVDVTPLLGVSAILVVPIVAATVNSISNIIATIFLLFIDRALYHGDEIEVSGFKGRVTRITAFRTFIINDVGVEFSLMNQELKAFLKYPKG